MKYTYQKYKGGKIKQGSTQMSSGSKYVFFLKKEGVEKSYK